MQVHDIQITDIVIPERLREQMDTNGTSVDAVERSMDSLKNSISKFGLLNPITITKDLTLVAGRRRLEAFMLLERATIPCHLLEEIPDVELVVIEVEENVRRLDMPWPDRAKAIQKYHELKLQLNPSWTQQMTAEAMNISRTTVTKNIAIASTMDSNPGLLKAPTFSAAVARAQNDHERIIHADLARALRQDFDEDRAPPASQFQIINTSFLDWAPLYTGPLFNFVHCDFPYGINIDKSKVLSTGSHIDAKYEDSEETFWDLFYCLLDNHKKFLAPQAHIMFWFSFRYYEKIISTATEYGFSTNIIPMIWHKTDNAGIASDVSRSPRHVYESALLISRGDRKIIRPVGDCYGAPSVSGIHSSIKPEPMLKHFFRMFVDETTTVLDPTCGSGSAIRAAQNCGAHTAIGLELSAEFAERAQNELTIALKKSALV